MNLLMLPEEERLAARERARELALRAHGEPPVHPTYSQEKSAYLSFFIFWLATVMCVTFFMSATRLFAEGYDTISQTISSDFFAYAGALGVVLMAESTAIAFTMAWNIIGKTFVEKTVLLVCIAGSVVLTISGNWQHALKDQALTVFSFAEAMLPVVFTLGASYILKQMWADRNASRDAARQQFERELAEWQRATSDPEALPDFFAIHCAELEHAIREHNARGQGSGARREYMQRMNDEQWTIVVARELNARERYAQLEGGDAVTSFLLKAGQDS